MIPHLTKTHKPFNLYLRTCSQIFNNMSSANLESYPPEFRHPRITTPIEKNPIESDSPNGDSEALPVIDLQSIDLERLRGVCADWGGFRLVNHGIPSEFLKKLEDHAKMVFELPFETKQEVLKDPITYFWGTPLLTQSGGAVQRGPQNVDWMEGFNIPLAKLPQFQPQEPTVDSFRAVMEEYGSHLARIVRTIFESMAKDLKLDSELSKLHLAESTGFVRVYRYPPCTQHDESFGLGVHTDSTLLAILVQDLVGGLEVLKGDKWIKVKPIPNTLIINLGDMMQAISDDEYKSVVHRVRANPNVERNSICYFVSPQEDFVIQSSKYKPFSYNEFRAKVHEDVKTVGNKVGLPRFKLA